MNDTTKTLVLSAGIFAIAVAGNVAARSIYTNSRLGADKKNLVISSSLAIGLGYILLKKFK